MTTESNTSTNNGTDETKIPEHMILKDGKLTFDINKLIDLPYSQMNESEIEFVIDYKANKKANNEQFKQTLNTIAENYQKQVDVMKQKAQEDNARQNELLEQSKKLMQNSMKRMDENVTQK